MSMSDLTGSAVRDAMRSRCSACPAAPRPNRGAVDHEAGDLEEHLRSGMRSIGGRIVLRSDLDHIAADDVDALQPAQDRLGLARHQAAHLRRAGARSESRVKTVDVEGDVGRAIADHAARGVDHAGDPYAVDLLGVDYCHAGIDREFPKIFRRAANADLHRALRIEHAVEHRLAEWSAMMKAAVVEWPHRVAMRIDLDHADRADRPPGASQGAQDRQRHGM